MMNPWPVQRWVTTTLVLLLLMSAAIWARAFISAHEHFARAQSFTENSPEQLLELRRAASFRAPLNTYAENALARLQKNTTEAGRLAYCDAIASARHPLWNDSKISELRCPQEPSRINLKDEAPLSFFGNLLTPITLLLWVFSVLGFIFKGLSESGALQGSWRSWGILSTSSFLLWCYSLTL